jgi:hypothetical protein
MFARSIAKYRQVLAIFLSALIMSGCSIHPLPDDFAHVPTYTIVRQIRCETRQAVIDSILTFLTSDYNHDVIPLPNGRTFQKVDDRSFAIGTQAREAYLADPTTIGGFNPAALTGFARYVVDLVLHTGIAYNFDLTGMESNKIDPEINFLRPLPIMTLPSLNAKGNFDRTRQNERYFTITDNFLSLITTVPDRYCSDSVVDANIIYPITGNVGMRKVVKDFMLLTLFGNLGASQKGDVLVAKDGPPTMVEQLQFVTTIGGSVTPKVTFSPVGRTFQVADANIGISASRTDTHNLTVGLFLDTAGKGEALEVRSALFGGLLPGAKGKGPLFTGLLTASGGRAEKGAAVAVEQFLQLKIFRPSVVFQP